MYGTCLLSSSSLLILYKEDTSISMFAQQYLQKMKDFVSVNREFIKPSSPTPHRLKSYKLSIFDQFCPPVHMPFILFYPRSNDGCQVSVDEKLAVLKTALSETLTRFYPLAGRIKNQTTIDCNDDGALFIEVKMRHQMMDCLQPPNYDFFHKLLPCGVYSNEPLEKQAQVAVQANIFACGGIALAITLSHKLVDGATYTTFLKAWAKIAHGNLDQELLPSIDNLSGRLFPANELCSIEHPIMAAAANEQNKSLMKRFVFHPDTISMLREKARSEQVPNPTRAEVVSAIIWKCAMKAYKLTTLDERPLSSSMTNGVNLRRRLNPRLPDNSIGNLIWTTTANYDASLNTEMELPYLVSLIRKSIDELNTDFLSNLPGEGVTTQILKLLEEQKESFCKSPNSIAFSNSSVSGMGFYEVNFGWGKPSWVTLGPSVEAYSKNVIMQVEGRNGEGIQAMIVLDPDEMEILEHDQEFMAYAALNPDVEFPPTSVLLEPKTSVLGSPPKHRSLL